MSERRIGRIRTAVVRGVRARLVTVEVHRGQGLPRQTLVGLAGSAVRESLDRIHAACSHCGLSLAPRRTVINLAPAGLRKSGAGLDLPIALALLAADGRFDAAALEDRLVIGELGLDGRVRGVNGVLPAALAAREADLAGLLVPRANAGEAAAVPGLEVHAVEDLQTAAAHAGGERRAPIVRESSDEPQSPGESVDLAAVAGLATARYALEVAAAGGHHLLLSGPPGGGKTLLARALPGILPPLRFEESLAASAVHSVVGALRGRGLLRTPAFRAPHHSISPAGLVGGGNPLRPGEISLATHGVLFLDELPEFPRQALECLRQPLEEGCVRISRANESHEFPARFQLVAAMNECPCGRGPASDACMCGDLEVERYRRRASGPLLDRIDLFVAVERLPLAKLDAVHDAEDSASVRERVIRARRTQRRRWRAAGLPIRVNARLPARGLVENIGVQPAALRVARDTAESLGLSARAWHRMLRVARTCADLEGADTIGEQTLLRALRFRAEEAGSTPAAV